MAILDFISDLEHSGLADFWDLKNHDIPTLPGAYILIANGSNHFRYPIGRSPIYYIGQSKNIRRRLHEHHKYSNQAKHNRQLSLYWPRYEYSAEFGGRYCYIRTWQGLTAKALEDILLARFAKKYRSFPVANGAGAWSRVSKIIGEI